MGYAVTMDRAGLATRKLRHIDACLTGPVEYVGVTTGFERYRLPYNALTQTSLSTIELGTRFLGAELRAPVLVGAMTGGAELSRTINRNLAEAAQKLGIGMMLGSQRIMLDNDAAARSFEVRELAPDVLLIGNIGLAQLSDAAIPKLAAALERVGADALAVHTNPLQEAMQDNGDTDFSGSLERLRRVAEELPCPVLVKEVGHGIGAEAAEKLRGLPIAAVDVAGAGGTSWAPGGAAGPLRGGALPGDRRMGRTDRPGPAGGACDAAGHAAGGLWRNPDRDGRRQGTRDGRRRGGTGPPAAGTGDRVPGRGAGRPGGLRGGAAGVPARLRGGRPRRAAEPRPQPCGVAPTSSWPRIRCEITAEMPSPCMLTP